MFKLEKKAVDLFQNQKENFKNIDSPTDGNIKMSHWLNAVIPFSFAVFGTLIGMVVNGYSNLEKIPLSTRPDYNLMNAISHSNSIICLVRAIGGAWYF